MTSNLIFGALVHLNIIQVNFIGQGQKQKFTVAEEEKRYKLANVVRRTWSEAS